jgi:serine/threonine-protein kinase RsbW
MKERKPQPRREFLLKMELRSNPCLLCVVRGAVERLAETCGFSAQGSMAVTRAVDEALTNIMRHAYRGALDRPIALYFREVAPDAGGRTIGALEIQLQDRGVKFDPGKVQIRKSNEVRPGGRGLLLIRQAMDVVEYTRAGRTNSLRLVKYFRGA